MKHLAIAVAVVLLASMFAGDGRGQTAPKKTLAIRTLAVKNAVTGIITHEAILSWTQAVPSVDGVCPDSSPNTAVTSNLVYRTVAGGASGTETLFATLTPAATSFTDTNVVAGASYIYEVSAEDCPNDGGPIQSPLSNEVAVTIPSTSIVTLSAPVLTVTTQ